MDIANHILIIMGSPRPHGNTEKLCEAFAQGAQENGKQCSFFRVNEMDLHFCVGCGWCTTHQGRCIQRDDIDALYSAFNQADGIVFASPLYFYTISAQLKTVIDRLYAMGTVSGFSYPSKASCLIMTAGEEGNDVFKNAIDLYERMLKKSFATWSDRGRLCIGGCSPSGVLADDHPALLTAREMGKEF